MDNGTRGLTSPNSVRFCAYMPQSLSLSLCMYAHVDRSEHAHSCGVLLLNKKFKIDGQRHTWIDFTKF